MLWGVLSFARIGWDAPGVSLSRQEFGERDGTLGISRFRAGRSDGERIMADIRGTAASRNLQINSKSGRRKSQSARRRLKIACAGIAAGSAALISTSARATVYTHVAGNGTFNVAGSWTNGSGYPGSNYPTSVDTALFNSTSAAQTDALGANLSIGEIQVTSPTGLITIAGDGSLETLTLYGVLNSSGVNVGIAMSTATQNLTFGSATDNLAIGAAQSWFVNAGRTLTISGNLTGSGSLTIGSGSTSAGGTVTQSATIPMGFTGSYILNNGVTMNAGNQSSSAAFVLNNGATLNGSAAVSLASTNFIYANSGTSTVSIQNAATLSALFAGNGNITWTEATINNAA
jgi:hypothetical protein